MAGDVDVARKFVLRPGSNLFGQSVRRADCDLVTFPTFHWLELADRKLVRVSLRLAYRPCVAGYEKSNTSLLEIRGFWERLEILIQRVLMGAVTKNKWWGSLKYRIRDFAIKYGRQFKLDRTKSLEDRLSWTVEGGLLSRRSS